MRHYRDSETTIDERVPSELRARHGKRCLTSQPCDADRGLRPVSFHTRNSEYQFLNVVESLARENVDFVKEDCVWRRQLADGCYPKMFTSANAEPSFPLTVTLRDTQARKRPRRIVFRALFRTHLRPNFSVKGPSSRGKSQSLELLVTRATTRMYSSSYERRAPSPRCSGALRALGI